MDGKAIMTATNNRSLPQLPAPVEEFAGRNLPASWAASRGSGASQEFKSHAAAKYLPSPDQLSLQRSAARGRRRKWDRAVLSGAHLQHPVPVFGQPVGVYGEATGGA